MYLSCEHAHKQNIGLETFWNESILVEIKVNRGNFLIGFFYIPQTALSDDSISDKILKGVSKSVPEPKSSAFL